MKKIFLCSNINIWNLKTVINCVINLTAGINQIIMGLWLDKWSNTFIWFYWLKSSSRRYYYLLFYSNYGSIFDWFLFFSSFEFQTLFLTTHFFEVLGLSDSWRVEGVHHRKDFWWTNWWWDGFRRKIKQENKILILLFAWKIKLKTTSLKLPSNEYQKIAKFYQLSR